MSTTNGKNRIAESGVDGSDSTVHPVADNVAREPAKKVQRVNIMKVATFAQRKAMEILAANLRDAEQAYRAANTEWGPAGSRYSADGFWFTMEG